MAYRTADDERWGGLDFILGYEIRLSNNHTCKGVEGKFADICDDLKGKYPKDFKWSGWHPQCRCIKVPILPSDKERDKFLDAYINEEEYVSPNVIKQMPEQFKDWYKDNEERIDKAFKAGKLPYFLSDNMVVELNGKTYKDEAKFSIQGKFRDDHPELVRESKGKVDKIESFITTLKAMKGVEYIKVNSLKKPLTDAEIIKKIGGLDATEGGSCSSLALAYIGNKAGFDVIDFRGGKSRNFFANKNRMSVFCRDLGAGIYESITLSDLAKKLDVGKEYYCYSGGHAVITKKLEEGTMQYLELQLRKYNGWYDMNKESLKSRFKNTSIKGDVVDEIACLDIDKLKSNKNFRVLLGFINTKGKG